MEDSVVIIFTNGPPDESANIQRALKTATALGVKIESRRIERLKYLSEGLNVALDDGEELYVGFLIHKPEKRLGRSKSDGFPGPRSNRYVVGSGGQAKWNRSVPRT
jgi:hypothetical protein